MKIGVLGTGNMGSGLRKLWAQQGHEEVAKQSPGARVVKAFNVCRWPTHPAWARTRP